VRDALDAHFSDEVCVVLLLLLLLLLSRSGSLPRLTRAVRARVGEGGVRAHRGAAEGEEGVPRVLYRASVAHVSRLPQLAWLLACAQVHLLRRLCERFGVTQADSVLQETLAKEARKAHRASCARACAC
jgi:hypothetical protein